MRLGRHRLVSPLLLVVALCAAHGCSSTPTIEGPAIRGERGSFALHKFEQKIGEERYEIGPDPDGAGDGALVHVDFQFVDRGTKVALTSTLRARPDGTPIAFEIRGKTARQLEIDDAVDARGATVAVRRGSDSTESPRPERFFTIDGYSPVAMQMLLMRYWASHGSPAELPVFPSGTIRIVRRGRDRIEAGGAAFDLDRYAVQGLIWGGETLWMDDARHLAALVTVDAEFDHFEAVRDDLEPALGTFVAKAASDGMAALSELATSLPGERAPRIAIVGGRLVDGTGAAPVEDSVVVVDSGRVAAAGRRGAVAIPADAKLVDASGKTVLPGLWDMHAHFEQVEWGPVYLAAGATTVRDCGNELEFITSVRDAIASRSGLGPRILAAGIVDGSGPHACGVQRVDDERQAREWVDRYHDLGFRQIKVYSSMKLENVAAVAREAHRLGMTVTGHVANGVTLRQAVEAGQDQVNHVGYVLQALAPDAPGDATTARLTEIVRAIDPGSAGARELFDFLREHRTVVDPTLAYTEFGTATHERPLASFEPGAAKLPRELAADSRGFDVPADQAELARTVFEKQLELVGALHRAGIPIVAGTDQLVPGHSLHREIELYVQAGFSPLEAIQAATIVPARAMGVDGEVGSIEDGKRADLILVEGDPLRDIHEIRRVRSVVTGGVLYDCASLWRSVGFQP